MEIFRLLGMIAIDNTEANRAIDETARRASDSEKKTGGSFSKIGSAAVSAGKWIAGAEAQSHRLTRFLHLSWKR